MIKYLKEYRFYISLFLFILIPITAIDINTREARTYRFYDKVILGVTTPIQSSISWLLDLTVRGFNNYIYLWNTHQDNLTLIEENRKFLSLISDLKETERENQRLRKLLNFAEINRVESIIARVSAKDVSTEFRALRLNRGERSGIKRNMAVLTSEGVVGRILRTTADTADVVTIVDLLSAVDAIVDRSRARGVVEGLSYDTCELKFALRTDDIQVGDVLLTSGLGGIFPRGIPVGVVSKVDRKPYGISQKVEVRPSVDFSKLEEVMVVTNISTEPINIAKPK